MKKVAIGIDNGVSGTIGIIVEGEEPLFFKTPVKSVQDYTKVKKNITRVDTSVLWNLLCFAIDEDLDPTFNGEKVQVHVCMERPMVNPQNWRASESAMRALEATWITVEQHGHPHSFCASTDWQKVLLPHGCKGPELKTASLDIGNRLYPQFKDFKHPDRDGLLIAHWVYNTMF